jgi:hypothetical protein
MASVVRSRTEQISVAELIRRENAEDPRRQSGVDRVERRVRTAIAAAKAQRRSDVAVRRLATASGILVVVSGFLLVALLPDDNGANAPLLPPVPSAPVTFTGATSAHVPQSTAMATMAGKMTTKPPSSARVPATTKTVPCTVYYLPSGGYYVPPSGGFCRDQN